MRRYALYRVPILVLYGSTWIMFVLLILHVALFLQFFFLPEDGDIDTNTGRVMILHPGTQVEEAGQ